MDRYVTKTSSIKPLPALAKLFAQVPLLGNETREHYDNLFDAIAKEFKPANAID
jgi:hypothetical protein